MKDGEWGCGSLVGTFGFLTSLFRHTAPNPHYFCVQYDKTCSPSFEKLVVQGEGQMKPGGMEEEVLTIC